MRFFSFLFPQRSRLEGMPSMQRSNVHGTLYLDLDKKVLFIAGPIVNGLGGTRNIAELRSLGLRVLVSPRSFYQKRKVLLSSPTLLSPLCPQACDVRQLPGYGEGRFS